MPRRCSISTRVVNADSSSSSQPQAWLVGMLERKHINVATVALAAKNARRVWAVLKTGRNYEPGYVDARFTKSA